MRGKQSVSYDSFSCSRITPADAGKTNILGVIELEDEDHPRGCGENAVYLHIHIIPLGSPPRMRGKLGG